MDESEQCTQCRLGPCPPSARKCDGLDEDIIQLGSIGVREGHYDSNTMSWQDSDGGRHSQRCNARRIAENGPASADQPDYY